MKTEKDTAWCWQVTLTKDSGARYVGKITRACKSPIKDAVVADGKDIVYLAEQTGGVGYIPCTGCESNCNLVAAKVQHGILKKDESNSNLLQTVIDYLPA